MKKSIFLLLMCLSLLNAFEVNKSQEFVKDVEPDIMSTSISATVEDKDKLEIQKIFEKAIEESKSQTTCTNGSYRISPNYSYSEQKRVFLGYRGDIQFECKFKDTKNLDFVISKLDSAASQKDKVKLTINPIKWTVDEQTHKEADKELELKALHFAKEYRDFLSGVYLGECKIKEVSLNSTNYFTNQERVYAMAEVAKSQTTPPIKNTHTIKYNASYKFECN